MQRDPPKAPIPRRNTMGMSVNTNPAALNAYRNLSVTDSQMSKSLERLSSGFRINRAADDAAGLAISEGLRSQIGGLKVAVRNTQDGVSVVQTAEGALTETHSILQRMRDLAVQSANDTNDTASRAAIGAEATALKEELDRIATRRRSTTSTCSTVASTTSSSRWVTPPATPSTSASAAAARRRRTCSPRAPSPLVAPSPSPGGGLDRNPGRGRQHDHRHHRDHHQRPEHR